MRPKKLLLGGIAVVLGAAGIWVISSRAPSPPLSVKRVNAADPKLQAAMREAQEKLPIFLFMLERKPPLTRFAVKVRFASEAGPEFLWVMDPSVTGEKGTGTLNQTPIAVRDKAKGDRVEFKKADIADWAILPPKGEPQGGFTEKALKARP